MAMSYRNGVYALGVPQELFFVGRKPPSGLELYMQTNISRERSTVPVIYYSQDQADGKARELNRVFPEDRHPWEVYRAPMEKV